MISVKADLSTSSRTVQDVAERIGREARRRGKQTQIMAMDALDLEAISKDPAEAVFVASTTGQVSQEERPQSITIYLRCKDMQSASSQT